LRLLGPDGIVILRKFESIMKPWGGFVVPQSFTEAEDPRMVSIYHLKAMYREHVPRMRLLTRVSRRIYHGYIALKTRRLADHFIDRNGLRFQFDSGNLIERQMATAGYWEEDTTHFIERFVKPGMIVAEVGANIGAHTLPIAARLMDGGRI
jgi:hypothetical protein